MPALFITIINYFLYGLNDSAYVLPFPIMYVKHGITEVFSLNLLSEHFYYYYFLRKVAIRMENAIWLRGCFLLHLCIGNHWTYVRYSVIID